MELLVFDGSYDAYFWVLCVDKFCKVRGISEKEKMALAATAMSGSALKWLNWWTPRHPGVDWNMFTISLLWRFKPEDRCIFPIVDDEEEPEQESSPLTKLDNSSEELTNVLKAWDAFLLSTDEMEVPLTKVVNGGNVYLPDATTTSTDELIENPKSLGDSKPQELATIIPLQENFRFPSSDSLLIKDCLLPRHLAPFDGTDYLEDEPIVASITLSSSAKINTTPISAMLPLHFISLFDPGVNHLVTLSLLPEPLDWTHEAVGSSPPPPEPPDCKYRVMDLFIALCYPLKPTCVLGNSAFVLELNSKFWNIRTACQVFAEMSNMLVCLNSLFCMCITTGRLNEKEFISYDALSNRLGTSMMDPGLTQRFRAIIFLSIRATWIPHFEKLSWDQFALPVINLRKFARVSLNIPKSMSSPLKLPCRSIQKVTAEFKVTWELAMLLPPLKPPDRVEIPMVRNSNSYANGLGIWLVPELTLRPPAKPPDLKSLVENRYGFSANGICPATGFAILNVIVKDKQLYHNSNVMEVFIECLNSLMKNHEIIQVVPPIVVIVSHYEFSGVIGSIIIVLCAKQGGSNDACNMFHIFPTQTILTWTVLMDGCARICMHKLASCLFIEMFQLGNHNAYSTYEHMDVENYVFVLPAYIIGGSMATIFQDGRFPYGCHEIFSTELRTHYSNICTIAHLLFQPALICDQLNFQQMSRLVLFQLQHNIVVSSFPNWAHLLLDYTRKMARDCKPLSVLDILNNEVMLELLVGKEYQNLLVYVGSDVKDLAEILEEFYLVFYPDQVGLARMLTEVSMNYIWSLLADWLYESCRFVSLSTFEYIGFQDFLYEASTCSLQWYHLPYEDNWWKVISLVLFNNKESDIVSNWVVCIFNVLKLLVGILQLATSISRAINDHEPYSNLVLKKHVQEHIYFECNLLVVKMITGCLVLKKGSLQFAQWDPGGFCIVHWEGSLNLEAYYFPKHCLSFNLEDKVDFNGGSNVMIQTSTCENTLGKM